MTPKQLAGTKTWVERYAVTGSKGDEWIVAKKNTGIWGCSCPKWKFHKAPKVDCHHIKALLIAMAAAVNVDFFAVGRKFRDMGNEVVLGKAYPGLPTLDRVIQETNATPAVVRVEVNGELFTVGRKFRLE